MNFFSFERDILPLKPDILGEVYGIPIANSSAFELLIILLFIVLGVFIFRKFTLESKSKFQTFIEILYEGAISLIRSVTGSDKVARRVFPLTGTILIFVAVANYTGLIPGISAFTLDGKSIFRTATSDFNTTLGLAVGSMLIVHFTMLREFGLWGYFNNFIKIENLVKGFRKGIGAGMMAFVEFLIGLLDIISEFAKVISLSLRLFGNMFAGDVLMTILVGIFAYMVPAAWLAMGFLSAIVQAIVFSALVTVFYTLAMKPESRED